ncbi:hypothetical protein JCM3770_006749 [Rhodotorula araucariae]
MSTHHGFIKEFPFIRVDAFHGDPAVANPYTGKAPHFYLLTHAHTDHIVGLNSPHFHGQIYATPVTKQLVLETMQAADRVRYEELGKRFGRKRKFANLCKIAPRTNGSRGARGGGRGAGMDRIKEIPLNTRSELTGPDGITVTVTALDANHCPGSCMFLIEGKVAGVHRAVLVTGDVRIEPWWLDALKHNPLVAPYLPANDAGRRSVPSRLDCLYIDTSNVLLDEELVTKDDAVAAVIDLMAQYPPDTRFFLNAWTWGYEELLKAVHKAFGEEIHLDWYKHRLYTSAPFRSSDPLLASLGTTSSFPSSPSTFTAHSPSLHAPSTAAAPVPAPAPARPLRFHACERRWKCDHVWQDGLGCFSWEGEYVTLLNGPKRLKRPMSGETLPAHEDARVVYVNPSEMPRWRWEAYREQVQARIASWREREERERDRRGKGKKRALDEAEVEDGELPNALIVPLARHSSLPELRSLVALFRPQTLYPLTCTDDDPVSPAHQYISLPSLFGSLLAAGGDAQLRREAEAYRQQVLAPGGGRTRIVEPSSQTLPGEADDLVEPRWVTEMSKKGLNIEGGWHVFDEVVAWAQRLEKGERIPSVSPKKRRREDTPPHREMLELSDSEDDALPGRLPSSSLVAPAPLYRPARQLSYGASSPPRAHLRPSELKLCGVAPYPPGQLPSPFLAAAPPPLDSSREITPDLLPPPVASTLQVTPTAAQPPRKSVTFASPSHRPNPRAPVAGPTRPCAAADAAAMPPPARPAGLLPSSGTTSSAISPPLGPPRTSTSTAPSTNPASGPTPTPAPAPAVAFSPASPPAAAAAVPTAAPIRPLLGSRAKRRAVVACLHRQLRGLIAPEGGSIAPFAPGDPRLQGKRALPRAHARCPAGSLGKENVAAREWPSPTSFRTVSASTSP